MEDKLKIAESLVHEVAEVIGELGKGDKIEISEVGMDELDEDDIGYRMLWAFEAMSMDALKKFGVDLDQFKLLVYERRAKKYLDRLEIIMRGSSAKFRKTILIGKKRKADAEGVVKP